MDSAGSFNGDKYLRFFIARKYSIYRHLLLLFILAVLTLNVPPNHGDSYRIPIRYIFLPFFIFLFYFNMYYLIPKFLFKNKYKQYFLSFLGCGIAAYLMIYTKNLYVPGPGLPALTRSINSNRNLFQIGFGIFMFMSLVFVAASTAIKLFQRWILDSQKILELERTTRFAELEQLKNQINPHFLFNMLNNTNVLTQKDPEKASYVLVKLSDFLRYQLYDSARPQVLLTSEMQFFNDFLELEKIRRDQFHYVISKEGDISGVLLPPLLFIAFVENAVKHSMNSEAASYVYITIEILNGTLLFKCINSKPAATIQNKKAGGLGLANARRRLELLYPGKHTLTIEEDADEYHVALTLKL